MEGAMAVTDAQVRKLMDEIAKSGNLSFAAMKARNEPQDCQKVQEVWEATVAASDGAQGLPNSN